jgi:nanoRNase/pAp phosphatase (c-di-AMP/oligoRNAs hydrolase)
MIKLGLILLMLLTGCTQAQPELRETKEVQTSIPYSDEELIESANDQIKDEAYYVDSITMQSDTEVWFSLKDKDLNKQYVFKYEGNELIPDRLVDNVD